MLTARIAAQMATATATATATNGTHEAGKRVQLAIELPQVPGLRIHLHLTLLTNSLLLFLTSSAADSGQQAASMGSLVYAMPDRYNPAHPMSTALYALPSSLDFATRMAKVLARKLQKPCYVGSSINLSGAAGGGTVDEERDAFRSVIEAVIAQAQD